MVEKTANYYYTVHSTEHSTQQPAAGSQSVIQLKGYRIPEFCFRFLCFSSFSRSIRSHGPYVLLLRVRVRVRLQNDDDGDDDDVDDGKRW